MFCEKCGAQNDDNALFCEKCGAKLGESTPAAISQTAVNNAPQNQFNSAPQQQSVPYTFNSNQQTTPYAQTNTYQQNAQNVPNQQNFYGGPTSPQFNPNNNVKPPKVKKPKKHFPVGALIAIIAVVLVIAGGVTAYFICKNKSKPEIVVDRYFSSVAQGNYTDAYGCLDIETSGEINEKNYATLMQKEYCELVDDYNAYDKTDPKTDYKHESPFESYKILPEGTLKYKVDYVLKNSLDSGSFEIVLNKQKAKQFLIFDTYKVDSSDLMVSNIQIETPPDATLTIDGNKISNDLSQSVTDSPDINFTIPKLFKGEHDITVSASYMNTEDYEKEFETEDSVDLSHFYLTDTVTSDLKKKGADLVAAYVTGICKNTPYETAFADMPLASNDAITRFKSYYESYCLYNKNLFNTFKVDGTECTDSIQTSNEDKLAFSCYYTCSYTTTTIATKDTPEQSKTSMGVTFKYSNGQWTIEEVD